MVFVLYLMIRSRDGNRTCPEYQILTTKIELDFTIEAYQTAQLITTVMLMSCSGGMRSPVTVKRKKNLKPLLCHFFPVVVSYQKLFHLRVDLYNIHAICRQLDSVSDNSQSH